MEHVWVLYDLQEDEIMGCFSTSDNAFNYLEKSLGKELFSMLCVEKAYRTYMLSLYLPRGENTFVDVDMFSIDQMKLDPDRYVEYFKPEITD